MTRGLDDARAGSGGILEARGSLAGRVERRCCASWSAIRERAISDLSDDHLALAAAVDVARHAEYPSVPFALSAAAATAAAAAAAQHPPGSRRGRGAIRRRARLKPWQCAAVVERALEELHADDAEDEEDESAESTDVGESGDCLR
jgi:hypothetical protein